MLMNISHLLAAVLQLKWGAAEQEELPGDAEPSLQLGWCPAFQLIATRKKVN